MSSVRYMPWSKRRAQLRRLRGYKAWDVDGKEGRFTPGKAHRTIKYKNYINRS